MTFELIDDVERLARRDWRPATPAILTPTNARYLEMGEWMQIDANYRMARGGDGLNAGGIGTVTDEATVPSWPMWNPRGAYSPQAIAHRRLTVLWRGSFEANTDVCDTVGGGGGGAITVGAPLSVWDITDAGGIVRRGLSTWTSGPVIGYCTRIIGVNDINFIRTLS